MEETGVLDGVETPELRLTCELEPGVDLVNLLSIRGGNSAAGIGGGNVVVRSNVGAVVIIEGGAACSGIGGTFSCALALAPRAGSEAVRNRINENRLLLRSGGGAGAGVVES